MPGDPWFEGSPIRVATIAVGDSLMVFTHLVPHLGSLSLSRCCDFSGVLVDSVTLEIDSEIGEVVAGPGTGTPIRYSHFGLIWSGPEGTLPGFATLPVPFPTTGWTSAFFTLDLEFWPVGQRVSQYGCGWSTAGPACFDTVDLASIESHVLGVVPMPPALALLVLGALLVLVTKRRHAR